MYTVPEKTELLQVGQVLDERLEQEGTIAAEVAALYCGVVVAVAADVDCVSCSVEKLHSRSANEPIRSDEIDVTTTLRHRSLFLNLFLLSPSLPLPRTATSPPPLLPSF